MEGDRYTISIAIVYCTHWTHLKSLFLFAFSLRASSSFVQLYLYRMTSLRFAILLHCVLFHLFISTVLLFRCQRFTSRNNHFKPILVLKYSYLCTHSEQQEYPMHSGKIRVECSMECVRLVCMMMMRNDSRTFMHILHDFDRFQSIKLLTTFC